jgi:hypothetical protein
MLDKRKRLVLDPNPKEKVIGHAVNEQEAIRMCRDYNTYHNKAGLLMRTANYSLIKNLN